MLDRVGGEKARATSIVKYAPGSSFPKHLHSGGEEILVLSGTFSDERGDYPTGWYLRNPPGSSHAPSASEGAVIFVKLRQMDVAEQEAVRIDTREQGRWHTGDGRQSCPLFRNGIEDVSIQRLAPEQRLFDLVVVGAEIFVLAGGLMHEGRYLPTGTWIRLPAGAYPQMTAGTEGATIYLKQGALGMGFAVEAS